MPTEDTLRVAVIGAGAMGSMFGAWLSTVSKVWLIDVDQSLVEAIQRKGLTLNTPQKKAKTYALDATTSPETLEKPVDLVLIFTKSHHTENAAKTAKKLLKSDGVVLTLQNGLGNYETLCKTIGPERSMVGVTSHGATLVEPGHVLHAGSGPTYVAKDARQSTSISYLLNQAGIETTECEDLQSVLWGKLTINAGINALAAILRVPNGALERHAASRYLMHKAVEETLLVAKGCGVSLPWQDPYSQVEKVCRATAKNRASMLQDILKGRRTETSAIHRAIAEKGHAIGIDVPFLRFLAEVVEALEETSRDRIT
jgi:2-dehydropantoate 2-reductase